MRIISTTSILVAILFIVAETPEVPSAVSCALQGGAMAVLAWMVWYLLSKHLPAERRASKEQQDAFLEFLRQERELKKK